MPSISTSAFGGVDREPQRDSRVRRAAARRGTGGGACATGGAIGAVGVLGAGAAGTSSERVAITVAVTPPAIKNSATIAMMPLRLDDRAWVACPAATVCAVPSAGGPGRSSTSARA